ncbi:Bug family tripartite tricarboxylate transporter substrate binding protein [Allopusillimonas ginsengisoli]|uniref:Bug family tripartite tricarboxylate transporter substrate binding protein n=1 Tax=Allopusillimonas ginsengisoli TaxID=453575 RepID=UPI0010217089|nr:tripartite tricarboxylate transporter substrate binding protein [Allopusillimonas ginsengisoli]TEA79500.1 tripartite tricarboxylate transporter substrate binding protein [Allopusillimonas ginsengisoli]
MLLSKTALSCRIAFTCLLTGAALVGPIAQAQYPEQPIKLLVPYPPGGATDVIGRVVGQALAERLNTTVVVENKSGASGSIGAADVAKSKPDGYTILLGALTSHSIYQNLYAKNATYDLNKDFSPVAIVGRVPLVFVTHPSVQADSLSALIAAAKKSPGKYSMASAGNGSPQQMASALFGITADVDFISVPYRGSGPAMTDLVGGQVNSMIETVPAAQSFIKSGALNALAVTSAARAPTLPDVPTAKEAGLDNFEVSSMFGVLAPAGTPPERINVLAEAVENSLQDKSIQDSLLAQGVVVGYENPEQAGKTISAEIQKWHDVIEKANIEEPAG